MSNSESYPPAYRCVFNDGDSPAREEVEPVLIQDKDIDIPVIDLERLDKEILREACMEWGIFRLENHGVPLALTSQVEEISKSLLNLPFENKRDLFAAFNSQLSYFYGTPALNHSGDALPTRAASVNVVEGFYIPLSSLSKLPASSTSCDYNAQESKLSSFRVLMEEYGRHTTRIAISLFEAIAQTLNLELSDDIRRAYISESTGLIRVFRYPRISGGTAGEVRGLVAHTDSSLISILKEDEVGGLEFMKGEDWFSVKPVANTLIVVLGDIMQAISDDEYKSVTHRVKTKKNMTTERHSVGYFVLPERDFVIKSSKYKPFTYAEFEAQVKADIGSVGAKIGLPRFNPNPPLFL